MSDHVQNVDDSSKKRSFDDHQMSTHSLHNTSSPPPTKQFAFQSTNTVASSSHDHDDHNQSSSINTVSADGDDMSRQSQPEDLRNIDLQLDTTRQPSNLLDPKQQKNFRVIHHPISSKNYFERELNYLIKLKEKLINYQHLSTIGKPLDDDYVKVTAELTNRFVDLCRTAFDSNERRERAIRESIVIQWPATLINTDSSRVDNETLHYDCPVLINACTTVDGTKHDHPTLRIRFFSLSEANRDQTMPIKAKFIVSLERNENVDDNGTEIWREGIGKLKILKRNSKHRKQLTAANKQSMIQESDQLIIEYDEVDSDSMMHYDGDNGTLIADFPMIDFDRKDFPEINHSQQKYRLRITCTLTIANNVIISHTLTSHQFVIVHHVAELNEVQIDAAWMILTRSLSSSTVHWCDVRQMFEYYIPAQLLAIRDSNGKGRALDREELQHLQCMLFFPLVNLPQYANNNLMQLEENLFGDTRVDRSEKKNAKTKIRDRLLKERVIDDYPIDRNLLFERNCVNLETCETSLQHSVFEWLHTATQLIISNTEMRRLFNKKLLTLSSTKRSRSVFKRLHQLDIDEPIHNRKKVILIRFCEHHLVTLSLSVTNDSDSNPNFFLLKKDEVANLIAILMDRPHLKQYDRLVQFDRHEIIEKQTKDDAKFPRKTDVFPNYKSAQDESISLQSGSTL